RIERDGASTPLSLACTIGQVDGIADLALGIRDHCPGQAGDLLRPHSCLHAQQLHYAVAERVAAGCNHREGGPDLRLREDLRLPALAAHLRSEADMCALKSALVRSAKPAVVRGCSRSVMWGTQQRRSASARADRTSRAPAPSSRRGESISIHARSLSA